MHDILILTPWAPVGAKKGTMLIGCRGRRMKRSLYYSSCGMEWTPPGCVKEVHPSLAYPACCPQVVCPQDNETKEVMHTVESVRCLTFF